MIFKGSLDALTSFPFWRVDAPTALCSHSGTNVLADRQKGKAWMAGCGGRFGWITRLKSSCDFKQTSPGTWLIDSPSVSSCRHNPTPRNTTDSSPGAQQPRCVLKQSEYLFVKLCWNGMSTLGYDPIKCHRFSANQRVNKFDSWMQRTFESLNWIQLKVMNFEVCLLTCLSHFIWGHEISSPARSCVRIPLEICYVCVLRCLGSGPCNCQVPHQRSPFGCVRFIVLGWILTDGLIPQEHRRWEPSTLSKVNCKAISVTSRGGSWDCET
jgi:hypothetical protein